MSDPRSDVNEAVCWQCGAPAVSDCACTRVLNAWASEHRYGQGYPVVRGWRQDAVRVPWCEACCSRNRISTFITTTGFLVGGVLGMGLPSWGWTTIAGGVVGAVAALLLGILFYGRLSGRRAIDDYPPLQRLRQAGWTDPN
jgi:hypothetical protein